MVIVKAPFRISYVGGGTDFPDYYLKNGGEVISAAIDKYIYVTVNHKFDDKIHLRYSEFECVDRLEDLKHNLVKEALRLTSISRGVEIVTISDIPAKGSGLGSSSSLAVALLKSLYNFKGYNISIIDLVDLACKLEIDILKSPIGKQDQYAAGFGGLNHIVFTESNVEVDNLYKSANYQKIKWLEESTMLFYLGEGHSSSEILTEHKNNIIQCKDTLDAQKQLVKDFLVWLHNDTWNDSIAGELVNLSWKYKKQMTPSIVDNDIERIILRALQAGAYGAKVCGSGRGGFLLVVCDKNWQDSVRKNLSNLQELNFKFTKTGVGVVYAE